MTPEYVGRTGPADVAAGGRGILRIGQLLAHQVWDAGGFRGRWMDRRCSDPAHRPKNSVQVHPSRVPRTRRCLYFSRFVFAVQSTVYKASWHIKDPGFREAFGRLVQLGFETTMVWARHHTETGRRESDSHPAGRLNSISQEDTKLLPAELSLRPTAAWQWCLGLLETDRARAELTLDGAQQLQSLVIALESQGAELPFVGSDMPYAYTWTVSFLIKFFVLGLSVSFGMQLSNARNDSLPGSTDNPGLIIFSCSLLLLISCMFEGIFDIHLHLGHAAFGDMPESVPYQMDSLRLAEQVRLGATADLPPMPQFDQPPEGAEAEAGGEAPNRVLYRRPDRKEGSNPDFVMGDVVVSTSRLGPK
eukprot:TRINITY_DN13324_c0_g1_i1.p1 TRINITY_DN13324_c0_g1~~TRINITY_DN13324_c0_g1_i1.p1  ORF type:complete len:361 (+),score=55.50 TRINITY_DN13324_c0_g1_i1:128-1210(+)